MVGNSLFEFLANRSYFDKKEWIALAHFLKEWIALFDLFAKYNMSGRARPKSVIKVQFSVFFYKKWIALEFEKLKRAICSFCSSCSFKKSNRSKFALVALELRKGELTCSLKLTLLVFNLKITFPIWNLFTKFVQNCIYEYKMILSLY